MSGLSHVMPDKVKYPFVSHQNRTQWQRQSTVPSTENTVFDYLNIKNSVIWDCNAVWLTLKQAQGGSRGRALQFIILGARSKVGGQRHALAALPMGKRPFAHYTRGWVDSRADLDNAENVSPTGIRSPDLPARSNAM
jgi:hypothetical protein